MQKVCFIKNLFLTLNSEIIFFNLKHIVMKKSLLIISLMLSALAMSCTHGTPAEETPILPGTGNKVVVTVNATLPGDLTWEAGDKVAINGKESSAVAEAGAVSNAFVVSDVKAPLIVVAPFEVLSGLNELKTPATQNFVADAFDRAAYVLAGVAPEATAVEGDEKNLVADVDLTALSGVISLPITLDSATAEAPVLVKNISFTALSNAALNGVWTAEPITNTDEAGVVTYDVKLTASAVAATTNLDCGEGVEINTVAPVYFNLVVPAGQYTGGFEIVVTDTEDHNFVLNLTDDVVVERGATVELTPSVFTVVEKAPATLTVKIGEAGVAWAAGDAVVCNNTLSTNVVAESEVGTQSAQFNFEAVAYPYSVFYPADFYTTSGSLRFYEEQPLVKNAHDHKLMVMAGYSTTNEVTLNNLCGIVSIPFVNKYEGENITVDKVIVTTAMGDPIAGKYHINYKTGALTSVAGKAEIVLNPSEETPFVIAPEETASVQFVVPKGSIRNGLKVTIHSSVGILENHTVFPTGLTVRGGETYAADLYEYKEVKIEKIVTAEELLDFAKCVNMGRYKKFINAEGKVVLGGDIDMSTLAEWVPITGKIDEATGLPLGFDGTFDGCGYSIKNWATSQPLFGYLGIGATVQNFVIDASCGLVIPELSIYSLDGNPDSNLCFGFAVASNLGGTVEGITNNADVITNCPDDSYAQSRSAIVGWNAPGGFVRNCINNGDITLELANHTAQTCYIGTVVGRSQSSADFHAATACGLYNLENHGKLTINIKDGITVKNFYIGGVSGSANSYTVVDNCKNYADVTFNIHNDSGKGAAVCMGGVIGYSAGTISNCYNEGNVSHLDTGDIKGTIVGGIVGYQNSALTNSINKGNITVTGKKFGGRNSIGSINGTASKSSCAPAAAGIVAYCYNATIDGCENYGKITFHQTSADGSGTSGITVVAGIVSAPWGQVSNCKNFGDIDVVRKYDSANVNAYLYVGGIAACDYYPLSQTESSIVDCVNEGNLTIENDLGTSNSAYGGIIGWPGVESTAQTNVTTRCVNKGNLVLNGTAKARVGGIQGGSGSMADCQNFGTITVNNSHADSPYGGLSGFHTQNHRITGSTNTGDVIVNLPLTGTASGIGGMIGARGNVAVAEGAIAGNTVKCTVRAVEAQHGVGMLVGHYNGNKVMYFGTAESPIQLAGQLQIGDTTTVVDASNVMDPAVLGGLCPNYTAASHIYNCVLAQ